MLGSPLRVGRVRNVACVAFRDSSYVHKCVVRCPCQSSLAAFLTTSPARRLLRSATEQRQKSHACALRQD